MDPLETLGMCRDALEPDGRDIGVALYTLLEYYQWRVKGGFEPAFGDARADKLGGQLLEQVENTARIARISQGE